MSSLSRATIHQEVRRYGEELAKLQERIALGQACEGEVKRRKVRVIFLEVDGVMVRRQRSNWITGSGSRMERGGIRQSLRGSGFMVLER
ncbi:MAG: hypothetical protein GX492_12920 [Firmicutes bacterium]|nr:hypothetical protein [Bacillota bacterium]